jgi:autotransporter translocation and assembly factor TamB
VLHSDACGARIALNIAGTLDEEPNPSYASNPEMDETNILSCLIRGVRTQDLDSDLAKFASGAIWKFSGLDREVRKVLPVDEIDFTTEYSSETRAYEPRVLVAKELTIAGGAARLEYSSSLSRAEDQEVRLRYRITPRLTLQGAWVSTEDVQPIVGDLGLDLKYRWEW